MPFRDSVKKVLSGTGGFGAYHRLRNGETLTVLMFHRVLPPEAMNRLEPDPLYTVTTDSFASLIAFLRRHYQFVRLEDVLASRARIAPLPRRALLVTFDDGWRDNLEFALPILQLAKVPSVIFVAMDSLGPSPVWWQEALLWALRSRRASFQELWNLPPEAKPRLPENTATPELELLLRFGALAPEAREMLLRPFLAELRGKCGTRQMLAPADLRVLREAGVAIGSHGTAHLPLTRISDAAGDLAGAREWLSENVDPASGAALSFPHGRYDAQIIETARLAQHRLMFTSDEVLNECPGGWVASDVLGRIPIAPDKADGCGGISAHKIAPMLFLRERRALAVPAGGTSNQPLHGNRL